MDSYVINSSVLRGFLPAVPRHPAISVRKPKWWTRTLVDGHRTNKKVKEFIVTQVPPSSKGLGCAGRERCHPLDSSSCALYSQT